MSDLLNLALEAHGGLDRWNQLTEITAHVAVGGALWELKGHGGVLADTTVTLDPRGERISYEPFGAPDRRSVFEPHRVVLETLDGRLLAGRDDPRGAFAGHVRDTPWDELHLAYFSGYAMWNYLTLPFLLVRPGVVTEEIEPWHEDGETWRRLAVDFPADVATHNTRQTFHFDEAGLLRRHDYNADVLGGPAAAHYTSEHRTFGGITFPTRRRVVPRRPDWTTPAEPVTVAIDLLDVIVKG